MNSWQILGIEPTGDEALIRRAYARQLKTCRPDSDPDGYQRLREAFEWAKSSASALQPDETDDAPERAPPLRRTPYIARRTSPPLSRTLGLLLLRDMMLNPVRKPPPLSRTRRPPFFRDMSLNPALKPSRLFRLRSRQSIPRKRCRRWPLSW